MNIEQVKSAIASRSQIEYIEGQSKYQVVGLGKFKNSDGTWSKGCTYKGVDGVYYTRPFDMFSGFKEL